MDIIAYSPARRAEKPQNPTFSAAQIYLENNIRILPIRRDGSKAPIEGWAKWETGTFTQRHILQYWGVIYPAGIGILGGACNGGLEGLDFEQVRLFLQFWKKLRRLNADLAARLRPAIVKTPRGYHIYSRCSELGGEKKLARTATGETLIEIRGEGAYLLAPGSPIECHPLRKPYTIVSGASLPDFLAAIPQIQPSERATLHALARTFDRRPNTPTAAPVRKGKGQGTRAGDDFNVRADFAALLESDGWKLAGNDELGSRFTRPGKASGTSARLFNASADHPARLYCFSTNAGLETERPYDAFGWFAARFHNGDFSAAAMALAAEGYGSQWKGAPAEDSAKIFNGDGDKFSITRTLAAANALAAELGFSPGRRAVLAVIFSEAYRAGGDGWFTLSLLALGLRLYPLNEDMPEKQRRKRLRIIAKQASRELAKLTNERDALRWLAESGGHFFPLLFEYEPGRIEKENGAEVRQPSRFRVPGLDILKRILKRSRSFRGRSATTKACRAVLAELASEAAQDAPELGYKPKPAARSNYRKSALSFAIKYAEGQEDKACALRDLAREIERLADEAMGSSSATHTAQNENP